MPPIISAAYRRPTQLIHWRDAVAMLESKLPVTIKCWKLSTGDIITYRDVICIGSHWRGGIHRLKMPESNLLRTVRDITIFEINGYEIYR